MASEWIPPPAERGGDEPLSAEEIERRPKLSLTFSDRGRTVEACVGESILKAALRHGIELDHNCGGWGACSTCHVIVEEGMDNITGIEDDEEDRLDQAPGLTLESRLACQATLLAGPVTVRMGPEG